MADYEYGRIKVLADKLTAAGVATDKIDRIVEGGELVRKSWTPRKKAAWMREAMARMDELLDTETRYAVREACACCLAGKRLQVSKSIAKNNASLEDRIKAANEAKFVFGNGVKMQDDGRILVSFSPEGLDRYECVCLRKAGEPISITYCYCCGGHAKHHLQTALGCKLKCTVRSSALASGGTKPCTFLFSIDEPA